jgi:polyisoprenoid-binding protein YceI
MTDLQTLLAGPARTWLVDRQRSKISFMCKSMWGLLPVRGHFPVFDGEGKITETGTVSGSISIDAGSIKTGIGKRDKHLASDDFFDAQSHPAIILTVEAAAPAGPDTVELEATLSVRGTVRELKLPARVTALDGGAVQVVAETTLDRNAFGVDGNMLGMVADKATIAGDVIFTPG